MRKENRTTAAMGRCRKSRNAVKVAAIAKPKQTGMTKRGESIPPRMEGYGVAQQRISHEEDYADDFVRGDQWLERRRGYKWHEKSRTKLHLAFITESPR